MKNDPIVYDLRSGLSSDPFEPFNNIPLKVIGGRTQLTEIPDRNKKVTVIDLSVTPNLTYFETTNAFPAAKQYLVDYNSGTLYFNPTDEGKTFSVSWYGRGVTLIPASRITTQADETSQETLQDIIDYMKLYPPGTPNQPSGDVTALTTMVNLLLGETVFPLPSGTTGGILSGDRYAVVSGNGEVIYY